MSTQAVLTLLGLKASQELKSLLENKHLYQHVTINAGEILKQQIEAENQTNLKIYLGKWATEELPKMRFMLTNQPVKDALTLALPNASLFCRYCQRREAFAPIWSADVGSPIVHGGRQIALPDGFQIFFLVYQCQRCFGRPEGFLVRREVWILGLHGRSPIELAEVPAYVPKVESWLYRDAVIAFNSGKIPAGLFYLRSFIEQFARRVTGLTGRVTGDEIMDAYYKALPAPNKDQMPSFREWYDKLSKVLHSVTQDVGLFETAKAQIEKHFDMRRVFEISEKSPAPEETKPAMAVSAGLRGSHFRRFGVGHAARRRVRNTPVRWLLRKNKQS